MERPYRIRPPNPDAVRQLLAQQTIFPVVPEVHRAARHAFEAQERKLFDAERGLVHT